MESTANHRPMQIVHNFAILARSGDFRAGLKALQAQGIGGIVTNMPFDNYMQSDAEWEQLRACLRACRELGMRVWIYDEKGYPSFFAGGLVLKNRPELERMGLYFDPDAGSFSVERSYEGTHNCNNYFAKARTPNLLEPGTVEEFLRVTHEQYVARLGPEFATVEAFFTDEPALNAMYFPPLPAGHEPPVMDSPDPNRRLLPGVPWSRQLADAFAGQDLTGLFRDGVDSAALRRAFYGLIGDQLADGCFERLQAWCRQHKVFSSGHLLWEENSGNHVPLYGNFLRCLMRLDIPGIDVLSAQPLTGWRESQRAALLAAAAAMLNGTRRIFTESSDHSERVHHKRIATPAEVRASLAWQASLGVTDVTYYFSSGVCPELNGKTFESLSADERKLARSPEEFRSINESVTRLRTQLDGTQLAADVFLYYPIELLQAAYYPVLRPWENKTWPPELLRIANAFHAAILRLLEAGIIPCLVDGRMLRELRQVQSADGATCCQIRGATAAAVVYPTGCQPPAEYRPADCPDFFEQTPELPAGLFARGQTRILKDNRHVAAGVMTRGGKTVLTLVNLMNEEQTTHVRTATGEHAFTLPPYEWRVETV